jgi:dTDP-4-dehydrorhamnose 3,5-epimerase
MDGVTLSKLKQIEHPKGDVLHAIKKSDQGFDGFGEAYFSSIDRGEIKGWKKHTVMTMNVVVPVGEIEFVIYDENTQEFFNVHLSRDNYMRLSVYPGYWMAFRGMGEYNLLLNVASHEHDPAEAVNMELDQIKYAW